MKNKLVLPVFLVIILLCSGKTTLAVDDTKAIFEELAKPVESGSAEEILTADDLTKIGNGSKAKVEIIADVNISNAEISELKKDQLRLVFNVDNSMELQSNLIYGLELFKEGENNGTSLADVKIFSEDKITIEKNKSVRREIIYQAPEYLNGVFVLWLKVKDESGMVLAGQSFNINLAGSKKFIEQSSSCYLTIEGENDKKYNLSQGVDLKKEEKLFFNCQIKNLIGEDVTVLPTVEFYQRDFYGRKTGELEASQNEAVTFNKDEEKLVKLAIRLPENPQAYDAKIVFKKEGKIVSNPVFAHFVLSGKSGTIINASLDKNQYKARENAQLALLWAGSADTFRDSRTGGSYLKDPRFEVEFRDVKGNSCGGKLTQKTGEFKTILTVPMEKDCLYPIVTIKLINEGQLLYEKIIKTEPGKEQAKSAVQREGKNNFLVVIIGLILVLILVIVNWFHWKKWRIANISKTGIFFLVFAASFLWTNQSWAISVAVLEGDSFWQTFEESTATGTQFVSMLNCGVSQATLDATPVCPVDYQSVSLCRFSNNNAYWYSVDGKVHGCYRDIVQFSYNLNNGSGGSCNSSGCSVDQGTTIQAAGLSIGANICNNGVTTGMVVQTTGSNPAQWIINSSYITNEGAISAGAYNFSTSGWTCGNYSAKFTYAFKHGYVSNVAADYDKIGEGSIDYSIKNCCSATCSTGPGCMASLTNGITTSATCCGGTSCYECDTAAGYTWNGTMCTKNCACSLVFSGGSCPSGTTCDGCNCVPSTACTGSVPADSIMCPGDDTGLTVVIPWRYVGTSYGSCSDPRKCEYYTPLVIPSGCRGACSTDSDCQAGLDCYPLFGCITTCNGTGDPTCSPCVTKEPCNGTCTDTSMCSYPMDCYGGMDGCDGTSTCYCRNTGNVLDSTTCKDAASCNEPCGLNYWHVDNQSYACRNIPNGICYSTSLGREVAPYSYETGVCRNSLDPTNATCTTSLSCTGSIPAGSMMCPATLTNVANPWHNVGPSALSCISGGNCEYYTPPALFDCGLSVPPGFYKCPGTIETGLAVAKNWGLVGTCNVGGSCEYIACPGALCSPATLSCSAGICGNKYQTCTSSAPIGSGCADPCTASSCTGSIYCPCNSGGWREIQ